MTEKYKRPASVPGNRDVYVPKHPTPASGVPAEDWREEPTGVGTDAQVFRAVKKLGDELAANKLEAAKAHGALKKELTEFKTSVDSKLTKQDEILDELHERSVRQGAQLDILVPMATNARSRPNSAETRAIAAEAVEKHATTTATKFRRDLVLKVVGGIIAIVTSTAFITRWLS
jgi:hypothetical protein